MSALAASATGGSPSDRDLVERYRTTRDPVHLGALFERYSHLALGVSLRYLRNREDAEDVVMEVYERLAKVLLAHEVSNFKSWLHSVVANQCRMALRRRRSSPQAVEASEELLDAVLASVPAVAEDDGTERLLEALPGALDRLPEGQKRCLDLFYLEGNSYAEVAARSGYSMSDVKSHIQNGKRRLRMLLTLGDG